VAAVGSALTGDAPSTTPPGSHPGRVDTRSRRRVTFRLPLGRLPRSPVHAPSDAHGIPDRRAAGPPAGVAVRASNDRLEPGGGPSPTLEASCGRGSFFENCTGCQKPVSIAPVWGGVSLHPVSCAFGVGGFECRTLDIYEGSAGLFRQVGCSLLAVCCCCGFRSFNGEFDPGSGRTLAAGLTHASRGTKPSSGGGDRRTGE
jgi:hypothetical protein